MPSHLVPDSTTLPHLTATIGPPSNPWTHSSKTGFNLTRSPSIPENAITLQTSTSPITIDPAKSALVIIDMQNFFLSPAFGRKRGAGHDACDKLVKYAIPAARKAGIRVVWVNWCLTRKDIEEMPAAVSRAFGFEAVVDGDKTQRVAVDKHGNVKHLGGHVLLENGAAGIVFRGLGSSCGTITMPSGSEIDAGGLLMTDSWNAALYPPLDAMYLEGSKLPHNPDVLIPKNRMSGLWGASTPLSDFLEKEGIKTLLTTGVNTDQCVGGTFMDAFSKGYDCVLLSDGAATTSPQFAQDCFEYNAANTFGFAMSCEGFARGVGLEV